MEIILKENIENLGFKDDIVKVKNGYGRNFLIPQGKAIMATNSARKMLEETLKQRAFKEKKIVGEARKIAEKIKALEIKITAKVGSGDKLFGSISSIDLVKAISTNGQELDRQQVSIPGKAIKRTGKYEATIRLHREVKFQFPFEVIPENTPK